MRWIYLIVWILTTPMYLSSANAAVDSSDEFNVNVFSLMPFGGRNTDGEYVGIIPEVLKEISHRSGYKFKIKVVPYKRMFLELENGVSDFAIFFKTPQSLAVAEPIVKVYTLKNIVVGGRDVSLQKYADLEGKRISYPLGNYYEKRFDEDKKLKKIRVPNFKSSVNLFLNKRTELMAGPEISLHYHLKNAGKGAELLGEAFF